MHVSGPIAFWPLDKSSTAVQKLLVLTGDQREQILAHRHIKLVSLARLVQDRRELQIKLQVCTACPSRSSCSSKQLML